MSTNLGTNPIRTHQYFFLCSLFPYLAHFFISFSILSSLSISLCASSNLRCVYTFEVTLISVCPIKYFNVSTDIPCFAAFVQNVWRHTSTPIFPMQHIFYIAPNTVSIIMLLSMWLNLCIKLFTITAILIKWTDSIYSLYFSNHLSIQHIYFS